MVKNTTKDISNTQRLEHYIRTLLNNSTVNDNDTISNIYGIDRTVCYSLLGMKTFSKTRNSKDRNVLRTLKMQIVVLSDEDGDRPIHIAVANENFNLVRKLCILMTRCSISVDITNYLRQTALHLAVMLGNVEITQLLLNFEASPLVCDRNGNSVLHLAVKSTAVKQKEILQVLLSHPEVKTILNSMNYEGYSPLHYAVFKNNMNAVKVLHQSGADINSIDGKSGRTALIHSILEQNIDMTELLLSLEASPQKCDYSGRASFDMALQIGNIQLIKMIEEHKSLKDKKCVK